MSYSQNKEDVLILHHFNGFVGRMLEIGANDGQTLSNSKLFIEMGWQAVLVEPSPKCVEKIIKLHKDDKRVQWAELAIGEETQVMEFHESGPILPGKADEALVSTLIPAERKRWEPLKTKWKQYSVDVYSWADFLDMYPGPYDFISIDAEGMDFKILSQIDLSGVRCVCVETNGIETEKYKEYCEGFGMRELHRNGENLIMVK